MAERTPLIAANWKMYKTADEAASTAKELVARIRECDMVETMIAPPFTALPAVNAAIGESAVRLGGQNLHWEREGAYTGEISAGMLLAAGCRYVIIGHSERRQYFGETDETVNRKMRTAVSSGLAPVLCVGETESERDAGRTFAVLDKQINDGLAGLTAADLDDLVLAYEPVWAIGTGKTATREQAQEVHAYLRALLEKKYGNALAKRTRIQYGGSVKPDNIRGLMEMPDVDGALVGGASLNAETFSRIILFNN